MKFVKIIIALFKIEINFSIWLFGLTGKWNGKWVTRIRKQYIGNSIFDSLRFEFENIRMNTIHFDT